MADTKLSALTADTSPTLDDLIYTVNDPSGTPASRRVTLTAVQTLLGREKLTAARTYYVRTDGSDSNTGLTNTAGGAFLTWQKAIDVVTGTLDTYGYAVTIQIGDGTYTSGCSMTVPVHGGGTLTIQGNSSTPSNVHLSTSAASASIVVSGGAVLTVKDFKVSSSASAATAVTTGATLNYSNLDFGTASAAHVYAYSLGTINCTGNYAVTGGATQHFLAGGGGYIFCQSKTLTFTGTLAFTNFAQANTAMLTANGNTFSGGTITGTRYLVQLNGVIQTAGGGANYFPGNAAGSAPTGGQYA